MRISENYEKEWMKCNKKHDWEYNDHYLMTVWLNFHSDEKIQSFHFVQRFDLHSTIQFVPAARKSVICLNIIGFLSFSFKLCSS